MHNKYKIVDVYTDEQHTNIHRTYVLYHNTDKKPALDNNFVYISTPVNSIAALSSLYIGCLEKLKALNYVVAVDNHKYISNNYFYCCIILYSY